MNNQPNDLVTLEWLMPLFDEQLTQLHQCWRNAEKPLDLKVVAQDYQKLSSALQVANLMVFTHLSTAVHTLVKAVSEESLDWSYSSVGLRASELLYHELHHYALMGTFRRQVVIKRCWYLGNILENFANIQLPEGDFANSDEASFNADDNTEEMFDECLSEKVALPDFTPNQLLDEQKKQSQSIWQERSAYLLKLNANDAETLSDLKSVSQYLWQAMPSHSLQVLWYLVTLWLENLENKEIPRPQFYAGLLGDLELTIDKLAINDTSNSNFIDALWIENLVADIGIQLHALESVDEAVKKVLAQLHTPIADEQAFFPRVLSSLESLIFGLDTPKELIEPLLVIRKQLCRRGWSIYEAQVNQVLTDLEFGIKNPEEFGALRWQIERQLQDLYGVFYNLHQTIVSKIGQPPSVYHTAKQSEANKQASDMVVDVSDSELTQTNEVTHELEFLSEGDEHNKVISASKDTLRQVRIAIEEVKHSFNAYLQHHNSDTLPSLDGFVEIEKAFVEIDLPDVTLVIEKLALLFGLLADSQLKKISWKLTDSIADSLSLFELFLDHLAQQIFDKKLLEKAQQSIETSQALLNEFIESPTLDDETVTPILSVPVDVVRYDDNGELAPEEDTVKLSSSYSLDMDVLNDKNNFNDSELLIKAREALVDDDFSMDLEIREIFIEEAEEVLSQMDEFLPLWQQNPQDLTPLTEIRRGFHTLKGSGRMVGANNVGEMAWAVENMLNRVLDGTLSVTDELVEFISETKALLPILVDDFAQQIAPSIDPAITVLKANNLLEGLPVNHGLGNQPSSIQPMSNHLMGQSSASMVDGDNYELIGSSEQAIPESLLPFIDEAQNLPEDDKDADPDIKEIFVEEAREVLETITPLFDTWRDTPEDFTILTDIRRGFHTLKGSGRMVGANRTGELAWAIENMLNRVLDQTIEPVKGLRYLVADVLESYPSLVDIFESGSTEYPEQMTLWIAAAHAYSKKSGDEFDYTQLSNVKPRQKLEPTVIDANIETCANALRSITSVNEMMASVNIDTQPQNKEEQEFFDIFIEEAREHIATIKAFVQIHEGESSVEVSDEIVRAFHTLRGASGSQALSAISEISTTLEHSLELLQQHDAMMTEHHLKALSKSVALLERYLNAYDVNSTHEMPDEIQNQQDVENLHNLLENGSETSEETSDNVLSVANLVDDDINDLLDGEWELETQLSAEPQQVSLYAEIMAEQAQILLNRTTNSKKFQTLLHALLAVYQHLKAHPEQAVDDNLLDALMSGQAQLTSLFDALAGSMSLRLDNQVINKLHEIAKSVELQASELEIEPIDTDIELLEIFLEEAKELDNTINRTFEAWKAQPSDIEQLKALQRYLHTVKGGARMAGIRSIGDLTHEAETIYENFVEGRIIPSTGWITVMRGVQDTLSLQIDYVSEHQKSFFVNDIIRQLKVFIKQETLPDDAMLSLPVIVDDEPEVEVVEETDEVCASDLENIIKESWQNNPPDSDILNVFLEEAEELVESSSEHLQAFRNNIGNIGALQALQRELHTIKGGSRMVSANGIADLAHHMETVYEELGNRRRPATKMVSNLLMSCHDWLANAIFLLTHHINPPMPTQLINALEQFSRNPDSLQSIPTVSLQNYIDAIREYEEYQKTVQSGYDISQMPPMIGSFGQAQEQSVSGNEMLRISADLMERMINLSGESAINRARIDMGISSLTNVIEEMGVTVQRLADQLRRMDIELETQILSQIDDNDLLNDEGFDPLEMDQYSSLNQLSKSLSESASDLLDIKTTLLEKTRDSENLLLQLSRTQNELQDGLMNSRIVPFSRLTPRLQRIVRQTSNELHKTVELVIINADDEMDRTILERITSPLEHMLRNAVDHGIESASERINLGKDRVGRITLEVLREGSEVVIHLTDDGSGIDVEAVRRKAISQGLIDPNDDSLTDVDVMQYIFNAGLTTTKKVTQISGRGVGMDVVRSEIRQLGGNVSVESIAGKGSRFTMRVPLTVAVSDALVVRAADRYYAIPLVQIERVVRINPEALFDYYQSTHNTFDINGTDYRLRYLNEILSGHSLNELTVNTNTSLPVIIIKNQTGQHLALQVDEIAGSRIEVVVKPLGKQLSHVAGISAATIMGDGSVMLILDLMALMRNTPAAKPSLIQSSAKKRTTVLVVDDSVTVRKVTSRFLERQGYDAIVAKDGIDAIEMLQELTPDLILLDIEMPRMDGFEVATQIRHNTRLKTTPIIMITSRTGEKHRQRAMSIGVNDYMGKPFQENELLDRMNSLLGTGVSS